MFRAAIGIIETIGQVTSIEVADAMTKNAEVVLVGREDVGGGYHAVCVRGDVGSVRAALEAGSAAAELLGGLVGVLFIPRPSDQLEIILPGFDSGPLNPRITAEQLDSMNVPQLRGLARRLPGVPMRGREISVANREQLLEALRALLLAPPPDSEKGH